MNRRKLKNGAAGVAPPFRTSKTRTKETPEVVNAHRFLTTWLNGRRDLSEEMRIILGWDEVSRSRILHLFEAVRQVVSLKIRVPPERAHLFLDFQGISRKMRNYAITPTLAFLPSEDRWAVVRDLATGTPYPPHETLAAQGLLELARLDLLDRVKLCICGKWFFARRHDGIACDTPCRQVLNYWNNPEIREKKKAQAKKNKELRRQGIGETHRDGLQQSRKMQQNAKAAKSRGLYLACEEEALIPRVSSK